MNRSRRPIDESRLRIPRRKRLTRKRIGIVLACLLLIGSSAGIVTARAVRPLPALAVTLKVSDVGPETVSFTWPESGEAAIALSDGRVLGKGPRADEKVPTASIAKLVTVLSVLQKHPLKSGESGPAITLSQADIDLRARYEAAGGSTVPVTDGEHITEYQMIEAMLLPSANNMADSLAIWAFGSLDAYRDYAQKYVSGLGMTSTTIGNDASGLSPSTISSATDLIKLGTAAYAEPVIREIAAKPSANIPVIGTVYSTNMILGDLDVNGLKTGTSDEAGNCFLYSAEHTFADGTKKSFIGVVMHASSDDGRFNDARTVLSAAFEGFTARVVALKGSTVGTVTSAWGQTSDVVVTGDLTALTWRGDSVNVTTDTVPVSSTIAGGQTVGDVKAGTNSARLVTRQQIKEPSLWWRIVH